MPLTAVAVLVVLATVASIQDRARPSCTGAAECRAAALAAAEAREYETFHDLAWRAVQQGRRNDPELMLLLARAQSLSGRPLDALVMLGRVADLGVGGDLASGDDFRRVRALPGWPDVERRLLAAGTAAPPPSPAAPPEPAVSLSPPGAATPAPPPPPAPAPLAPAVAPPRYAAAEALRFDAAALTPSGLAYDPVSRRFIVGDREGRKLSVVDEFSHQVANLAGARSAGFGEVTALEIDARDGTLWVVSAEPGKSTLHQMQLISGRLLASFSPPSDGPASRFVDVAVGPEGAALVLDRGARRIWRLRRGGRTLEHAGRLPDIEATSLAPAPDGSIYVAHRDGLARVEPGNGAPRAVPLLKDGAGALARIRWHGGALVGVQESGSGTYRAVRLHLTAGGRAIDGVEVLDPAVSAADPAAFDVSGGALYYLSPADGGALVIRRVQLPG
jgi:hypothetical protein